MMIITREEAKKIVRELKGKVLTHAKWGDGIVAETEAEKLIFIVDFGKRKGKFIYPESFSLKHLRGNVKVHAIKENITPPKDINNPSKNPVPKIEKKLKSKAEKEIENQMWFSIKHPLQGGSFTGK